LTLHLTDLCMPGRVSNLSTVQVPLDYFESALNSVPIQATVRGGYLTVRRSGELLHLEFKAFDDATATKASVRVAEVVARLEALTSGG